MPDILKNREEKDFMYRIFIVEDDRGIAQAIQEQAEMWGLQAKCAGDFITTKFRVGYIIA